MLLQFIPLPIYKFCLCQFSPRLFGSPNVHSTLRSMNREGFSRRSSTVGPGFITTKPKFSRCAYRYAYRQGNSSRNVVYIFSKLQLFEVQPCADPESYVRGWRADNGPTLNAGLVALWFCRRSGPVLLRNSNFFVIFQGGGADPLSPLSIRPWQPRISAKSTLPKPAGT